MTLDPPREFQLQKDQGHHGRGQMALPNDFVNRQRNWAEQFEDRLLGQFYV
jgi:hypothetical protein